MRAVTAGVAFATAVVAVGLGSAPRAVAATAPPRVSGVSAADGALSGGGRITVTGTGFTHVNAVAFGSARGTRIIVASSRKLTVTAPKHSAGAVDVRVHTAAGWSPVTKADRFTYVSAPVITRVAPASGPSAGGTRVTVTGTNFLKVSSVGFGSLPGTKVTVSSAKTLTVTAPKAPAGRVDVWVRSAFGRSASVVADRYTYLAPAPTVTALSSRTGPVTGGQTVRITGTDLTGTTAVAFGRTPAASFTVVSATRIDAVTPAAFAATVDVRVTTGSGTSAVNSPDRYQFSTPDPANTATYTPSATTRSSAAADVVSVTGGQQDAAGPGVAPWQVTLASGAVVPAAGARYYLPPGTAAYPSGLAGTVSAVDDADGGTHVLTVTAAPLDDAFDGVSVDYTGPLGGAAPSLTPSARQRRLAAQSLTAAGSGGFDFGRIGASAFECTAGGEPASLRGSVTLEIDNVASHYRADFGSLVSSPFVEAYVQYEQTVGFDLTSEAAKAECELSAEWQNTHKKLFFLGDTGAVLSFSPDVSFSLSASGTVSVRQHSYHVTGFITQSDGSLRRVDGKSADPVSLAASGDLTAEAYGGVAIQLGLLDRIGVGISAGGGLKATAKVSSDRQVCADIGPFLRVSLYAYLDLWVKKWTAQSFSAEADLPVAHACVAGGGVPVPNPPDPPVITTTALPDGSVGASYAAMLTTADHRSGTWAVVGGSLPPGLALAGYTVSGRPTAAGFYGFQVGFTDAYGDRTTATASISVAEAAPPLGTAGSLSALPADATPAQILPAPGGRFLATYTEGGSNDTWLVWRTPGADAAQALDLPVPVGSVAFGTDGTAYLTTGAFNSSEGGEVLAYEPGATSAGRLHSFGTAPDGDMRGPSHVAYGNGSLYVEALSPHAWGSCDVVLVRMTPTGATLNTATGVTDCGAWSWTASSQYLTALEDVWGANYIEYFDPVTLALVATQPVPANIAAGDVGPADAYTTVGGPDSSCADQNITRTGPGGQVWSLPVTAALGLDPTDACAFGGLAAEPDGTADILALDAAGVVLAVVDSSGQPGARTTVSSADAVNLSMTHDRSGHLYAAWENPVPCPDPANPGYGCTRTVVAAGAPGGLTPIASLGGTFGDSVSYSGLTATDGAAALLSFEAPYFCGLNCGAWGTTGPFVKVIPSH
ncbi:IPT/TIG domain-containing protein [Actinacidiphila acididurans]|uniref:IPT/TIG domain-containing protein n=1 Tax=Actinacidiphila acididurans TaxID=2784346 RepID=A0ABS2TLW1_9ACTN|nr:IPT/TIG domain-containing protein [Actinacidiphila acididurans]MBM9504330.1 IPT/TIG domain-containing protein [Actinacidiphila acididurans]